VGIDRVAGSSAGLDLTAGGFRSFLGGEIAEHFFVLLISHLICDEGDTSMTRIKRIKLIHTPGIEKSKRSVECLKEE
jgi:hypothetical protein